MQITTGKIEFNGKTIEVGQRYRINGIEGRVFLAWTSSSSRPCARIRMQADQKWRGGINGCVDFVDGSVSAPWLPTVTIENLAAA